MVNFGRLINQLAALTLSAAILAGLIGAIGPAPAGAAPVTWSFFETAITSCGSPTACVLPPQPFVLMTLTLPGPTSVGTATWLGTGSTPVYTGDSFILTTTAHFVPSLTPAFAGDVSNPGGASCRDGPAGICDFNISWSETAGVLTSLSINLDSVFDDIGGLFEHGPFGLTGGPLASDGTLGGCSFTQCTVSGFWQNDLAVPEPTSVALLASGLFAAWLDRRRRTRRVSVAKL